jgi:DNA-binding HxlR family transcriptional regulator
LPKSLLSAAHERLDIGRLRSSVVRARRSVGFYELRHDDPARRVPTGGHSSPHRGADTNGILTRMGEKWSTLVVLLLRDGPCRFNDIKRNTAGISQQMPTRTLHGLERDGIVARTILPTSPPQVEYSPTPLGRSMSEPVLAFGERVRAHLVEFAAARRGFDEHDGKAGRLALLLTYSPKRFASGGAA